MKAVRKFGVPFWPWRRMNVKQAKLMAKMHKKHINQAKTQDMKRKKSSFFYQTRAKKLLSLVYGKLHVSYLHTLFKKAHAQKGHTIQNFFAALDTRLDTTLYRVQFAPTLHAARQLITHHKVCVNHVILSKPGYILQPGDVISIAPEACAHVGHGIQQFLRAANTQHAFRTVGLLRTWRAMRRKKIRHMPRTHVFSTPRSGKQSVQPQKAFPAVQPAVVTHVASSPATWTAARRLHMRLRMALHWVRMKRTQRVKCRVSVHAHTDNTPAHMCVRFPKRKGKTLRFQRTASNMAVKTWVTHTFARALPLSPTHASKRQHMRHTRGALFGVTCTRRTLRRMAHVTRMIQKARALSLARTPRTRMMHTSVARTHAWKTRMWHKHTRAAGARTIPFRFVTKKVFYKPTHVEVNYHTLHIVYLFPPQYLYFPLPMPLQHIANAFQR